MVLNSRLQDNDEIVDVFFEGPVEGDANDHDANNLDEVTTQLVQADFDGFHPLLGPVQIRLRDDLPSLGQITEQVNDNPGLLDVDPFAPGNADSFFDVFFEITLPATGQTLVTANPTRVLNSSMYGQSIFRTPQFIFASGLVGGWR